MALNKNGSEMDKELLLAMDDSDDAVEEFKLPQTRKRRLKPRKGQNNNGEVKVGSAAPGSSILSWKCAFVFVLLTVLLSGSMIVAFYMLNMQSQIIDLQMDLEKVTNKQKSVTEVNTANSKRLMSAQSSRVNQLEEKMKKLTTKVQAVEKKVKNLEGSSTEQLSHRFKLIENDVDSLKTGMAKSGGDHDKLRDDIDKNANSIESLEKHPLSVVKQDNKPANVNDTILEKRLDVMKETLTAQFNDKAKTMVAKDSLELSNLKSITDSLRLEYMKAIGEVHSRIATIEAHTNRTAKSHENSGDMTGILLDIALLKNITYEEKLNLNEKLISLGQVINRLQSNITKLSTEHESMSSAASNKSTSLDSSKPQSLVADIAMLKQQVGKIKLDIAEMKTSKNESVTNNTTSDEMDFLKKEIEAIKKNLTDINNMDLSPSKGNNATSENHVTMEKYETLLQEFEALKNNHLVDEKKIHEIDMTQKNHRMKIAELLRAKMSTMTPTPFDIHSFLKKHSTTTLQPKSSTTKTITPSALQSSTPLPMPKVTKVNTPIKTEEKPTPAQSLSKKSEIKIPPSLLSQMASNSKSPQPANPKWLSQFTKETSTKTKA